MRVTWDGAARPVRVAPIPDGRQPDELSDDELKKIFGSF